MTSSIGKDAETSPRTWLIQKPDDDVATAIVPLPAGTTISLDDGTQIEIYQPIPFGHKFSIRAVAEGTMVRKYGQVIGVATEAIQPGAHVHVHNLASTRGRGDLVRPQGGTDQ